MSIFKKVLALFLTMATVFAFTGCADTTWAAKTTNGEYNVRAGIYLYYLASAYSQAITTAQQEDSALDTTDEKAIKELTIEDKNITDWIKDTATESMKTYLQIQKKFDEMELSLSDDDTAEIKNYIDTMWSNNEEMLEKNGISEQSLKDIITSTYKSQAIFDAYYKEGGLEEVPEDELQDYFAENYARIKWIAIDLKDGSGNLLTSDEDKAKLKKLAETYLKEAQSGKNFDEIIGEYTEYVSSVSEEAAADTATETEQTVTEESPSGNLYKAEEDDSDSQPVSTLDDIDSSTDALDEEKSSSDDSIADLESNEENEVTTIAETDESGSEETTTTTDPYANEKLIQKGVESSGETTEVTYSPSKTVNNAIFDADLNKPFIIEDEEVYYVIVRYDILERGDLWIEDTIDNLLSQLKNDEYIELLKKVITDDDIIKNEESYKRYDPLKLDLS